MRLHRYPTGWTLDVGTHRIDYWQPKGWAPLSVRHRRHWWGLITHERLAPAGPPEGENQ